MTRRPPRASATPEGPAPEPLDVAVLAHLHHPIGEPYAGGLETHTGQVCRALAARGHRVRLFAKEGSRVPHPGVEVVPVLPESFTWHAGSPDDDEVIDEATLRACRLSAGSDVVLNNTLNPMPYTELPDAAVLTVLHTPATLERVTAAVQQPGWRPGARHAWASVSHANATGWRELLPVPVTVVHNGIDLGRWPVGRPAGNDSASDLVWSARITAEKGLHVALDALAGTTWTLTIAGPVSDADYHDAEIVPRLRRLGDRARYVGHLDHDHLPALLGSARAFLCTPLWDEPFGLAPLEAMATGTPVAALARGALPELLGDTGGICVDSPAGLPDAIGQAARLPRAGVRQRAELFSQQAMVEAYERLLRDMLQAPAGPGGRSGQQGAVQPVVLRAQGAPLGDAFLQGEPRV